MRRLALRAWLLLWAAAAGHGPEYPEQLARDRTFLNYTVRSAEGGRRLEAVLGDDWEPIRIHVDTTELAKDVSPEELRYLRDDVLAAAVRWLSLALRVRPVVGSLQFEKTCNLVTFFDMCMEVSQHPGTCGDAVIPNEHFRDRKYCKSGLEFFCDVSKGGPGLPNADFALYVSAKDNGVCGGGAAAHGSTCQQDQNDRPIAGNLNYCRYHLQRDRRWHSTVATTVHEILHTLGFSSSMFAFFRTDGGEPRTQRDEHGHPPVVGGSYQADPGTVESTLLVDGRVKQYVVLPRVVEAARRHYGCSTLRRVPLEDTGSDSTRFSHWDDHYMYSEIMTPDVNTMPRISELTLALLEDSGWYKPDYSQAGGFFFGRGKGCAFVREKCIKDGVSQYPDTFCTVNGGRCGHASSAAPGCAHDLMAKAYCSACTHDQPLPSRFQYFSDPRLGGTRRQMNYCPSWEVWGDTSFCQDNPPEHYQVYGEAYNADARCVMSNTISKEYIVPSKDMATCRRMRCARGSVLVGVGQIWVNCSTSEAGQRKAVGRGWKGTIICPSHAQVCGDRGDEGPGGVACRFPGVLRDGRCVCAPGYVGEDCAVEDKQAGRADYPYGLRYRQRELQLQAGMPLSAAPGLSSWPLRPSLSSGRGPQVQFTVSPPLPAGLSLAAGDGTLSGTPRGAAPRAAYTIRAAGRRGASSTTVFIAVLCPQGQPDCQSASPPGPAPAATPSPSALASPAAGEPLLRVVLPAVAFSALQADPGLEAFAGQFAAAVAAPLGRNTAVSRLLALQPRGVQVDIHLPGLTAPELSPAADRLAEALEDSGSGLRDSAFGQRYMEEAKLLTVTADGLVQVWPEPQYGETFWENVVRRWPFFAVLSSFVFFMCGCCCSCPARRRCRRKRRGAVAAAEGNRAADGAAAAAPSQPWLQQPQPSLVGPVVIGLPVAAAAQGTNPKASVHGFAGHPFTPVTQVTSQPAMGNDQVTSQPAMSNDQAMSAMLEMGYDFGTALDALRRTSWDVDRAVGLLSVGR